MILKKIPRLILLQIPFSRLNHIKNQAYNMRDMLHPFIDNLILLAFLSKYEREYFPDMV